MRRYNKDSKGQRLVFRICLLAEILIVSLLVVLGRDPDYEDQQYTELAEAILEGHTSLNIQVPDEILYAEDPYEKTWYEGYDRAYYKGKVYVYFGIVPCLLFFLIPTALGLTVHEFIVQWLLCMALCVGLYLLYRKAVGIWLEDKAPFSAVLFGYLCLMNTSYILWNANTSRVYEISCLSGLLFAVLGFWCYLECYDRDRKKQGIKSWLAVGSLCMALTVECRPNMILWCFLAIPLLWDALLKQFWKDWKKVICAGAPYLAVAVGCMVYNAIRFDSPLQFGQIYVSTGFDIKKSMTVSRIIPGLKYYYLKPPVWKKEFPFMAEQFPTESFITPNFRYFSGLCVNLYSWLLLLIIPVWGRMKRQAHKLWELCLWLIGIAFVQSLVDIYCGGLFHRYFMDFAWAYAIAAALITGFTLSQIENRKITAIVIYGLYILLLGNIIIHVLLNCRNEGGFYYTLIRVQRFLDKVGNHIPFIGKIRLLYFEAG